MENFKKFTCSVSKRTYWTADNEKEKDTYYRVDKIKTHNGFGTESSYIPLLCLRRKGYADRVIQIGPELLDIDCAIEECEKHQLNHNQKNSYRWKRAHIWGHTVDELVVPIEDGEYQRYAC